MSQIPQSSRQAVYERDNYQCQRCGVRGQHWHHRRTRAVKDEHQHCACNGITLCDDCHRWVHAHPEQARTEGFIVSRYTTHPGDTPIQTIYGPKHLECEK